MLKSPAPRNVLLVVLALGVIAAASVGLAGKKTPQTIEFEPTWDPEQEVLDKRGPLLEGNTWIVRDDRFTARLTQLDDDQRWRYIKAKTRAEVDPFMDTDMDSPGFLTFALELKSKVDGNLVLRPERWRLITNRKEFRHPMDIVTIETAYRLQEAEVPPAYYAAETALVPSEVILDNGDGGAGLLVYKSVDVKTKSFVIEMLLTTPKGKLAEYLIPYRKVKKKKG
jgi:hypothetical protein